MSKEEVLRQKIAALKDEIATLQTQEAAVKSKLVGRDHHKTVKDHIKLLHEYNEIRDLAQSECANHEKLLRTKIRKSRLIAKVLLSKIAVEEHTTQAEIMRRFGVDADD